MQVSVAHFVLGFSYRSRTATLQCSDHTYIGEDKIGLLDAGAYLQSREQEGRRMGLDVLVRPLEVAWIDGLRVVQSWNIEIGDCHE